jgi:hypothetical protein
MLPSIYLVQNIAANLMQPVPRVQSIFKSIKRLTTITLAFLDYLWYSATRLRELAPPPPSNPEFTEEQRIILPPCSLTM